MRSPSLDLKIVTKRMENKSFYYLGEFLNTRRQEIFKCKICEFEWPASFNTIFCGRGCPRCARVSKLSNSIIDKKLEERHIIRIGNYINNNTAIEFKCLKHDFVWKTKPRTVLSGKDCKFCGGKSKLTNEIVDDRLLSRKIIRLSEFENQVSKMKWKCDVCNGEWQASFNTINSGSGCPDCKLKNETRIRNWLKVSIKQID